MRAVSGSHLQRRIAWALVALILVALACGDDDAPQVPRLLYEDFETRCGDLPCGWDQIAGTSGQARYATGFHAGEHGLVLEGSGVTARGPGGDPMSALVTFGGLQARLAVRCDAGATLVLRIGVREVADGTVGGLRADSFEGRLLTPPTTWGAPVFVNLNAASALADGGFGTSAPTGSIVIDSVTLTKTGPGQCVIDHLEIDDVGTLVVSDISC